MTETDKFCLKWNEFDSNLRTAFKDFREEKDFFDVTLVCEEEKQVEAHKIILSACSLLFRKILKQNKHQHPLIYLKDIKYSELLSLLNFMYLGEVNVAQEDLSTFLTAAEELKVNGLAQNSKNSKSGSRKSENIKKDIIQVPQTLDNSQVADYDIAEEPFSSQSSSINIGSVASVSKDQFYQMYDDTNDVAEDNFSMIYDTGRGAFDSYMTKIRDEMGTMVMYECNACKKTMRRKDHMKNHVQTHFPQQEVNCQICGATCKNIPSLKVHISAKHRKGQSQNNTNADTDTDSNPLATSPITITDHLV